jgi:hypothetical protein
MLARASNPPDGEMLPGTLDLLILPTLVLNPESALLPSHGRRTQAAG